MHKKIWDIVGSKDELYPHALENRHPHVLEKIAELWDRPIQLDRYFESLMINEPGRERQGFAPPIVAEIFRMQQQHLRAHPPKASPQSDPWALVEIDKQPDTLSLKDEFATQKLTKGFFRCAECADCSANRDCLAIEAYLRQGVPVDATDEAGLTALMIAAYNGNDQAVAQLLQYGANVHAKAQGGYCAIHWAALGGNSVVLGLLIEHRSNVNAVTRYGLSPLLQAATNGHLEACRLLIRHGALVNRATVEGWMPLHKASANGHAEIVRLLLEHGANRDAEDAEKGVPTPLALAIKNRNDEIVALLSG